MGYFFNNKILKTIPLIFLLLISIKIIYTYNDIKDKEFEFAKKEAEALTSYVISNRTYYQKLFLDGTIKLNETTLKALPAYSSKIISDEFSKNNKLNITVRTVSDNARNETNYADIDELKAIKYFNENSQDIQYFSNDNSEYYQYASVLRIKQVCLSCHGKKENAPLFIQKNYANAYNYKLGDVRGIISVKVPTKELNDYFFSHFFKSIMYDVSFLLFIFIGILYLLKKSKNINKVLGFQVKEKTKELKNSLYLDNLTQLPNRLKLIEDIRSHTKMQNIHLAVIDIDSFKDINYLYGFEIADKFLKQIAQYISKLCDNKASLYKLPTDEYAILKSDEASQLKFVDMIKNIITKIQESKFQVNENSLFITLSCGIASGKRPLLTKANSALQIAKSDKKSIVVYDDSFDTKEKTSKNIAGISLIKNAIKENQITPYYQPIYNTNTKSIEKYESLARIILDNGQVLEPSSFLDISIKSKLYHEITKAMIRKSFQYFKDKDYEFSINISIHDIQDKKTFEFITDSLDSFQSPKRIVFEILESDKVGNYEELKEFIKVLKTYGCKVAIDDFGSGYSNFSHILALNVDYLKIDASLVRFITTDENSKMITKTIINFASSLGLKTIAEFVEDKEALDLLEEMGVDFVQGYYIGKPKESHV